MVIPSQVDGEPWVQKSFLKESGKLRTRERYWHPLPADDTTLLKDGNHGATTTDSWSAQPASAALTIASRDPKDTTIVLPDAICIRKYLRFFKYMLTNQKSMKLSCFLLESVVDCMDYRNQAPVLHGGGQQNEMAAPQERSTLQQLMKEGKFIPFCDLSIRENQDNLNSTASTDEWNWFAYESLSIEERSRNAMVRAARVLLNSIQSSSDNRATNPERANHGSVVILVDVEVVSDTTGWGQLHVDEGIQILNLDTFFQPVIQSLESADQEQASHLLSICKTEYDRRNANKLVLEDQASSEDSVQEYWSTEAVSTGMRKGELLRGRLDVTKENSKEAFVRADGKHWFIDIRGGNHNRAIHEDVVVIQPLPPEKWGRPVGKRRLVFSKDSDDDQDTLVDSLSFPTFPSAQIVAIHSLSRRSFVATMVDIPLPEESAVLLVPMDIRIPKIRVPTRSWQKLVGMRLLVHVDEWPVGSNYPQGHVAEVLGPVGDLESEIKCLLCENEVRLDPFSVAASACLPQEGAAWTVDSLAQNELNRRRDLRETHQIFSVDPIGCQDIDDTMHARYLSNGDVEIGVHIADVTWFVPLDSALDREARIRGTTFYLVDRRFDMLPGLLSSNLCSLHDNTDRLAVSVIWTLSPDLKTIKSTWFGRTIIHNVAAMTYEQAANILEGKKPESDGQKPPPPLTAGGPVNPALIPSLRDDLALLTKLARMRRKGREDVGGAVDLSSGDLGGELKFTLVNGKPVSVKPKQDLEIHHTIAELMIWANTSVATKIYERFPGSSLLRIHREVEEDRFDDLKEMLTAGNVELRGKTNMELADTLKKAGHKTVPVVASLFRSLATRAMSEAQYISSGGAIEGQNLSHYGLGLSFYTHFTSPIRRYADVVVHHQLMAALTEPKPLQGNDTGGGEAEKPLSSIPDSAAMSMLNSKAGITASPTNANGSNQPINDDANELVAKMEGLTIESDEGHRTTDNMGNNTKPFSGDQVTTICDRLNLHTRLAKQCSFECQGLFLSLFFKDHVEVTEAVVSKLKENGFEAYIPRFDIRAPVYLRDSDGFVQMDPSLLNLPPESGHDATLGFAWSKACRRFARDHVELELTSAGDALHVRVDKKTRLTFQPLTVMSVEIFCSDWDHRARIPSPRVHLVPSNHQTQDHMSSKKVAPKHNGTPELSSTKSLLSTSLTTWNTSTPTLFDIVRSVRDGTTEALVPSSANLEVTSNNNSSGSDNTASRPLSTRTQVLKGRIVFGNFVNPNTKLAEQLKAQQEAAEAYEWSSQQQPNAAAQSSRRDSDAEARRVEREVTARQQRLAKEKRESRRPRK